MTPANIAGMAKVNGLSVIALTDHNTTKNTRAFCAACETLDLIPIPGIEITTAEDIHLVALFESLAAAEAFDLSIQSYRILYKNPVDIYGHQYIYDENDAVLGEDPYLLSNALTLSVSECVDLARNMGAVVYPAHIDREANGIISILGAIPSELHFPTVEIHDPEKTGQYVDDYGLHGTRIVYSSDAHYLWDIQEPIHYFDVEESLTPREIREHILNLLGGNK